MVCKAFLTCSTGHWAGTGLPAYSDTGYSDITGTVTHYGRPNTVTVSGEACTNYIYCEAQLVTELLKENTTKHITAERTPQMYFTTI